MFGFDEEKKDLDLENKKSEDFFPLMMWLSKNILNKSYPLSLILYPFSLIHYP